MTLCGWGLELLSPSLIWWLLIWYLSYALLGTEDIAVTRKAHFHEVPEQRVKQL